MNPISDSHRTVALAQRVLTDCFAPASSHAIDRYTDSPRVRGMYAAAVGAFPDATFDLLWSVADDQRVAMGGRFRATHKGEWRGVPATGRSIDVLATVMLEVSDNGILDLSMVTDSYAMAEQMGVVESLGPKACELLPGAGRTPCGDAMYSSPTGPLR